MARREPLKVPRASLAVSMLDDPELIEAYQTPQGREAVLLFVSLILAAKVANNAGVFTQSPAVLAMLVRWPLSDFKLALDYLLAMPGRWLIQDVGAIVIRSFARWNAGWGGHREGAGRPAKDESKAESSRNQAKPTPLVPASVSVPDTSGGTTPEFSVEEFVAYAELKCGLSLKSGTADKLLKEFGTAPLVEVLEHLASRDRKHWDTVKNPAGLVRSKIAQAADGVDLGRQGDVMPLNEFVAARRQAQSLSEVPA